MPDINSFMQEVVSVLQMHFETHLRPDMAKGHNLQMMQEQANHVFNKLRASCQHKEEMEQLVKRLALKRGGY